MTITIPAMTIALTWPWIIIGILYVLGGVLAFVVASVIIYDDPAIIGSLFIAMIWPAVPVIWGILMLLDILEPVYRLKKAWKAFLIWSGRE